MHVGAQHQAQIQLVLFKPLLQGVHCTADGLSGIGPQARNNVGCARHTAYSIAHCHSRHFHGFPEVCRTVVNGRQDVAMKIDHGSKGNQQTCSRQNQSVSARIRQAVEKQQPLQSDTELSPPDRASATIPPTPARPRTTSATELSLLSSVSAVFGAAFGGVPLLAGTGSFGAA